MSDEVREVQFLESQLREDSSLTEAEREEKQAKIDAIQAANPSLFGCAIPAFVFLVTVLVALL